MKLTNQEIGKRLDDFFNLEAAGRYALACQSDPFAYARALTHLRNGVAYEWKNNKRVSCYDAEYANGGYYSVKRA